LIFFTAEIAENAQIEKLKVNKDKRGFSKTFGLKRDRHSGQAKPDPESRIFEQFWIPAFAGMTE
jgi:hypothetical protein